MAAQTSVIVFVKAPIQGTVKTRLARSLGDDAALAVYQHFVADVVNMLRITDHDLRVYFTPSGTESSVRAMVGEGLAIFPQQGSTLGEKMRNALTETFQAGISQAVLIGSDIPDLPPDIINEAFAGLDKAPAATGPSPDGGYYLIGFNADSFLPDIFSNIEWGTETVFSQTMECFQKNSIKPHILPMWDDIDTAGDLKRFTDSNPDNAPQTLRCLHQLGLINDNPPDSLKQNKPPQVSVVMPVMHEAPSINRAIDNVKSIFCGSQSTPGTGAEIIVVDGDPENSTINAVASHDVKKIQSPPGRAVQMNHGAAAASGDCLLFLHADTALPQDAGQHIANALGDSRVSGGAFDLAIDSPRPVFRMIEKSASIRSRLTRIPYGDQAIFIKRAVFNELGGFKDIPIMEDVELMQRMKRQKHRIKFIAAPVRTSARRWDQEGALYCSVRNTCLITLYYLGVSPEKLKQYSLDSKK